MEATDTRPRNDRGKMKKRSSPEDEQKQTKKEEAKRRKHVETVTALGEQDESIRLLEDLVFGAEEELVDRLVEEDGGGGATLLDEDSSESEAENEARLQVQPIRKAVWEDEEDELPEEVDMSHRFRKDLTKGDAEAKMTKHKLQQRMKEQFQKSMGGTPSWAETKVKKKSKKKAAEEDEDDDDDDDDEDEDGDDLLRKTGNFVRSSESLPKGIIRMKTCLHANHARPSDGRLTTVQFHPSAQVVMTAGLDQSISLFQVDGQTNPKIQTLQLERFPVHKARFSHGGGQVVATSFRNRMFYRYDMMEGKVVPVPAIRGLQEPRIKEFEVSPDGDSLLLTGTSGHLHLLTLKTMEVVRSMKINGSVSGAAFSPDGSKIYTHSEEGEVYVWDARSSRCLSRFPDDGCVRGTAIAASANGQYLACGSQAGVVNLYSQEACVREARPRPLKALMNLLTPATSLAFNPASEVLAMASRADNEALRLVHLPSYTVFSNFPVGQRRTIHRTHCLDFSPNNGFFSLANDKGRAPLFRLLHYKDF